MPSSLGIGDEDEATTSRRTTANLDDDDGGNLSRRRCRRSASASTSTTRRCLRSSPLENGDFSLSSSLASTCARHEQSRSHPFRSRLSDGDDRCFCTVLYPSLRSTIICSSNQHRFRRIVASSTRPIGAGYCSWRCAGS